MDLFFKVLNTKSFILIATKMMRLLKDNHPDIDKVSTVTISIKENLEMSYK